MRTDLKLRVTYIDVICCAAIGLLVMANLFSGRDSANDAAAQATPVQRPPQMMVPRVCRSVSIAKQARRLELDQAATSAVLILAAEEIYAHGLIGFAAVHAPADAPFELLFRRPDAAAVFLALYEASDTTIAGRLHALRGLRYTDPARFDVIANRLEKCELTVAVQHGCTVMQMTVPTILQEIRQGSFAYSMSGLTNDRF